MQSCNHDQLTTPVPTDDNKEQEICRAWEGVWGQCLRWPFPGKHSTNCITAQLETFLIKLKVLKKNNDQESWAWRCTPVITAVGRPKQGDHKFNASLGCVPTSYLKTQIDSGGWQDGPAGKATCYQVGQPIFNLQNQHTCRVPRVLQPPHDHCDT